VPWLETIVKQLKHLKTGAEAALLTDLSALKWPFSTGDLYTRWEQDAVILRWRRNEQCLR